MHAIRRAADVGPSGRHIGNVWLALTLLIAAGCAVAGPTQEPTNAPYIVSVAPGLQPRMNGADAVRISRSYLAEQTIDIAVPEMHVPSNISVVWAVAATDASSIDPCVPGNASDQIVWVTRGDGDYLNLKPHPWSMPFMAENPCRTPATTGTVVIDDASGQILGVYPGDHTKPAPPTGPFAGVRQIGTTERLTHREQT